MIVATVMALFCLGFQEPQPQSREKPLQDLKTADEANRASIKSGHFRFDYECGGTKSLENAREGRFLVSAKAKGLYAFEGENATVDPAIITEATTILRDMQAKVREKSPRGTRDHTESDRFLRASLGFMTMLRTPNQRSKSFARYAFAFSGCDPWGVDAKMNVVAGAPMGVFRVVSAPRCDESRPR